MKRKSDQSRDHTEWNTNGRISGQLSFDELFDASDNVEKKHESRKEISNFETDHPLEKEFISLVKDFDQFIDYVENHSVQLTNTKEYISRKYLPDINNRLTERNEAATGYTEQEYYPYIHLFYYLSLSGRLLKKGSGKAGKLYLCPTERLQLYKELSNIEKYFFLLETFWVDVNWARLINKRDNPLVLSLQDLFFIFSHEKLGYTLKEHGEWEEGTLSYHLDKWSHFLLYFEWFGFWECEINQERVDSNSRKNVYFAKSITLTDFGSKVIPILFLDRNFQIWNIAERKQNGEVNPLPGAELEDMMFGEIPQKMVNGLFERMEQDQSSQPFFEPFKSLYPDAVLQTSLPRNKKKFVNGIYTFKISFTNGVWRKVVLADNHTMEHLHNIILNAFNFDDDHLYSFFMDGEKWSNDCITSPNDHFGHPQANKVKIGDLGLVAGQHFMYLYDYGDEWVFTVEVSQIQEIEPEPFIPFVKESKGEPPDQYGECQYW